MARCRRQPPARAKCGSGWRRPASIQPTSAAAAAAIARWNIRASIPNSDGAGIVDQIGDGVTRLKLGQRVWLFNGQRNGRAFGTAAEYISLAEHLVTPLPDRLSYAKAPPSASPP